MLNPCTRYISEEKSIAGQQDYYGFKLFYLFHFNIVFKFDIKFHLVFISFLIWLYQMSFILI